MNWSSQIWARLFFLSACCAVSGYSLWNPPKCFGDSVWNSATDGSWLDPTKWNGAVPINAGDAADLIWSPQRSFVIEVPSLVTLGSLDISSPSTFYLFGAGSLRFDQPGSNAASLQVLGLARTHRITVPVAINDADGLNVNVPSGSLLTLEGGISSTSGNLTKLGVGMLEISAASSVWTGAVSVDAGEVFVRHNQSLGTTAAGTLVKSGATLTLDRGLTLQEPLQLSGGSLRRGGTAGASTTVTGTIELLSSSQISSPTTTNTLNLQGQIFGPGGVSLTSTPGSAGGVFISGNNTYDGLTTITTGRVTAQSATALGSAVAGTTVNTGAELVIQHTTAEPITINGGLVNLNAAVTATGPVSIQSGELGLPSSGQFSSPITLTSASGTATLRGSGATFTGGTTGTGNVQITSSMQVNSAPLSHAGSTVVFTGSDSDVVTFNTANGYNGKTEIRCGKLIVNHIDALGTGSSFLEMFAGSLELNEVPQREIRVGDASMTNFRNDQPLNRDIRIKRGTIRGVGVYNGPVFLDAGTAAASLYGGTFNGVISGSNPVIFGLASSTPASHGQVNLAGANTFSNIAEIRGPVFANSPQALGSTIRGAIVSGDGTLTINALIAERIHVVDYGEVILNAEIARLPQMVRSGSIQFRGEQRVVVNAPSTFHQHYDINEGYLDVKANTTIDSMTVRQNGKVVVAANTTLNTTKTLELQQGEINGRIAGANAIRKTTGEFGLLTSLGNFPGRVDVDKGVLRLSSNSSLGTSAGGVYVNGARDAVLKTFGALNIDDDVYLNNATGIEHTGGLFIEQSSSSGAQIAQVNGRLDLGSIGSILGAPDSPHTTSQAELHIHGQISGGSLEIRGLRNRVSIYSGGNDYTGATRIREGTVFLVNNGSLATTSAIELFDDIDQATLILDNRTNNHPDRIGDTVPVNFRGGELQMLPSTSASSTEAVGSASLLEGHSSINFSSVNSYLSSTLSHRITLDSIGRAPGASATVEVGKSAEVHVANPPAMPGGLLPWLIAVEHLSSSNRPTNFATITERGIVPISSSTADIHTATPADNVYISTTAPTVLTSDKTINSISFVDSGKLDLGGRRLTVETGGMLLTRSIVSNGTLTAGALGGYELVLHNGGISASIVDNGPNPVKVNVIGGTAAYLSGVNSYTGATYVTGGDLGIENAASFPTGGDLQIVGGNLKVLYSSATARHLGDIRIAGDGAFTTAFNGIATLSFDQLLLEDGTFRPGRIVGNGAIVKRTTGVGTIDGTGSAQGTTYNGQVVVEAGQLTVTRLDLAKFRTAGGTLVLPEAAANEIVLAGGALEFQRLTGTVEVTQPTRLIQYPYNRSSPSGFLATLRGSGDLIFDNRMTTPDGPLTLQMENHSAQYTGKVAIQTASVAIRYEDTLGSGDITIHSGGKLTLSPLQDSTAAGRLNLANKLTLAGGEIAGRESTLQPQRLMGNVDVSGNSYLSGIDVQGAMRLANDSRLTIASELPTRIFGDLKVGGTVELGVGNLPPGQPNQRGLVDLRGRIVADAAQAVLNIENGGISDFSFNPSVHVPSSQSLKVHVNQELVQLNFGSGKTVTGGGLIHNPVQLLDSAIVSPGQSPGQLSFAGNFTFGARSVYEWELANPLGAAGSADGWDLLSISGELAFAATPSAPMRLRIAGWPKTFFPIGEEYRWLIASADTISGFNAAAMSVELGSSVTSADPFLLQHFEFDVDGGNLFLNYQVPEPASAVLILLFAVAAGFGIHRRRSRHAGVARLLHP